MLLRAHAPALVVVFASFAPAQTLTRGPSIWGTTSHSFLVAFRSSIPATGTVEWGPNPAALVNKAPGLLGSDHAIRIGSLDADRSYYYRVLLNDLPVTPVCRTRTFPPASNGNLSFVVLGDCGTGGEDQRRVAQQLERWSFQLVLMPGDVIYPRGERENFDPYFFAPYRELLKRRPFFPVLGNHDAETEGGAPYLEAFHLPTDNSNTERWYSFDAGAVHFFCLDTTASDLTDQANWLRNDLADARKRGVRWIFGQFHHPPYSSGVINASDLRVRGTLAPIIEEFEVDAVFCGHEHNYERTLPIKEFHPDKRGVVYFVVGTGGYQDLYDLGPPQPFSAYSSKRHGFLKVDVRNHVLYTEFVDASTATLGARLDSYQIRRGSIMPALRATSEAPVPGADYRFELTAPIGVRYAVLVSSRLDYSATPFGIYQLTFGLDAVLTAGAMQAENLQMRIGIPNNPSLVGSDVLLQAVTQTGSAVPELTHLLQSLVR